MRANLNAPPPSNTSARATAEVDSSSEEEFQDSNTEPVPGPWLKPSLLLGSLK